MSQQRDVGIRIREAKLTDAPELAALMCELGYKTTRSEMRQRVKSILNDARYATLVAAVGYEVRGMIGTMTHMSHEHNDLSGRINALRISKRHRRSGMGRALSTPAE